MSSDREVVDRADVAEPGEPGEPGEPAAATRRVDPCRVDPRRRRTERGILAVVALPFVVLAVAAAATSWTPTADLALELLQISEVASRHIPLYGAWSRWGWNHPGPLSYYLLAPFTWVLGASGALAGTALLNGIAAVAAVGVAIRRAGLVVGALCATVCLLLCVSLGPTILASPWNPWLGLIPLFAFAVLVMAMADGMTAALPGAVAVGTYIVQAHVGFAAVVGGVAIAGIALAVHGQRGAGHGPAWRRSGAIAVLVGVVLWLPALVQPFVRGPWNLRRILSFAVHNDEPAAGWSVARRVMDFQLGLPRAWVRGDRLGWSPLTASPWPATLQLVVAVALAVVCARRGPAPVVRALVISLVATVAGLIGTAKITGPLYDYLVRWWWVIAGFSWWTISWAIVCLVPPAARRAVGAASLVVLIGTAGYLTWGAVDVQAPYAADGRIVAGLSDQAVDALDRGTAYVVDWEDRRAWGGVGVGVFVELHRRGFDVLAANRWDLFLDAWQLGDPATAADRLLLVGADDLAMGLEIPPGLLVATIDQLTPEQRRRADEIWQQVAPVVLSDPSLDIALFDTAIGRDQLRAAGLDGDLVDELAALRAHGSAYDLYLESA